MKKKIEVIVSETMTLVIDDKCLTKEALDEFEELFYPLDEKDTREDSLYSYVASCLVRFDNDFIEGVGQAVQVNRYSSNPEGYPDAVIFYDFGDQYVETEFED